MPGLLGGVWSAQEPVLDHPSRIRPVLSEGQG
jgi:hypothetical protein